MKVLVLAVLCVIAFAGSQGAAVQNEILGDGPKCPIPNPIDVDGPVAINFTLDPLAALIPGSWARNVTINNLNTLKYTCNLVALPLGLNIDLNLTKASGSGFLFAEGYLDATPFREETFPSGEILGFSGSGFAMFSVEGLQVKGKGKLCIRLNRRIEVSSLTIDILTFNDISVYFHKNFNIGEKPINWDTLSRNLKANFDKDFADHRDEIIEKIRRVINGMLGELTAQEFFDLFFKWEESECETY